MDHNNINTDHTKRVNLQTLPLLRSTQSENSRIAIENEIKEKDYASKRIETMMKLELLQNERKKYFSGIANSRQTQEASILTVNVVENADNSNILISDAKPEVENGREDTVKSGESQFKLFTFEPNSKRKGETEKCVAFWRKVMSDPNLKPVKCTLYKPSKKNKNQKTDADKRSEDDLPDYPSDHFWYNILLELQKRKLDEVALATTTEHCKFCREVPPYKDFKSKQHAKYSKKDLGDNEDITILNEWKVEKKVEKVDASTDVPNQVSFQRLLPQKKEKPVKKTLKVKTVEEKPPSVSRYVIPEDDESLENICSCGFPDCTCYPVPDDMEELMKRFNETEVKSDIALAQIDSNEASQENVNEGVCSCGQPYCFCIPPEQETDDVEKYLKDIDNKVTKKDARTSKNKTETDGETISCEECECDELCFCDTINFDKKQIKMDKFVKRIISLSTICECDESDCQCNLICDEQKSRKSKKSKDITKQSQIEKTVIQQEFECGESDCDCDTNDEVIQGQEEVSQAKDTEECKCGEPECDCDTINKPKRVQQVSQAKDTIKCECGEIECQCDKINKVKPVQAVTQLPDTIKCECGEIECQCDKIKVKPVQAVTQLPDAIKCECGEIECQCDKINKVKLVQAVTQLPDTIKCECAESQCSCSISIKCSAEQQQTNTDEIEGADQIRDALSSLPEAMKELVHRYLYKDFSCKCGDSNCICNQTIRPLLAKLKASCDPQEMKETVEKLENIKCICGIPMAHPKGQQPTSNRTKSAKRKPKLFAKKRKVSENKECECKEFDCKCNTDYVKMDGENKTEKSETLKIKDGKNRLVYKAVMQRKTNNSDRSCVECKYLPIPHKYLLDVEERKRLKKVSSETQLDYYQTINAKCGCGDVDCDCEQIKREINVRYRTVSMKPRKYQKSLKHGTCKNCDTKSESLPRSHVKTKINNDKIKENKWKLPMFLQDSDFIVTKPIKNVCKNFDISKTRVECRKHKTQQETEPILIKDAPIHPITLHIPQQYKKYFKKQPKSQKNNESKSLPKFKDPVSLISMKNLFGSNDKCMVNTKTTDCGVCAYNGIDSEIKRKTRLSFEDTFKNPMKGSQHFLKNSKTANWQSLLEHLTSPTRYLFENILEDNRKLAPVPTSQAITISEGTENIAAAVDLSQNKSPKILSREENICIITKSGSKETIETLDVSVMSHKKSVLHSNEKKNISKETQNVQTNQNRIHKQNDPLNKSLPEDHTKKLKKCKKKTLINAELSKNYSKTKPKQKSKTTKK